MINQEWHNFHKTLPNAQVFRFVFILSTHVEKYYHMLSKTLIFTIVEKIAIKDQKNFIMDIMG